MTYPDLDIKNLTVNDAQGIYWRDWWERYGLERAGLALGFQLFDAAINHGSHRATELLQAAAGVAQDGIAGPRTIAAVKAMDPNDVLLRFLGFRLQFMTDIRAWPHWGRGWSRRIAKNLLLAAEDN
jgi:lysozyme family protein